MSAVEPSYTHTEREGGGAPCCKKTKGGEHEGSEK
jgi:hypothetical protein